MEKKKYSYEEQKKFFFRYLKENGLYSKYLSRIHNKKHYNCYQKDNYDWTFDKCAKLYGMQVMLSMLINWASTPEGFDYWNEKNSHFRSAFHNKFF